MLNFLRHRPDLDIAAADALRLAAPPASGLFQHPRPAPRATPISPVVWLPKTDPPRIWLDEVGADPVALCPPVTHDVGSPIASISGRTASERGNPESSNERMQTQSTLHFPRINLFRLPDQTVVLGGRQFITVCGNRFLGEQFPVCAESGPADIDSIAPFDGLAVADIRAEVLLVARFGIEHWNDWVTELLPKVILAERAFPGRFSFALPDRLLGHETAATPWVRMRESLEACGIDDARILSLDPDTVYRFHALHAVTPVWFEGFMHPRASQAVRDAYASVPSATAQQIDVLPFDAAEREQDKVADPARLPEGGKIDAIKLSTLSFIQLVAAFKGAIRIVGLKDDDVGNIVFAPTGVRVLLARPINESDLVFRALILDRQGQIITVAGTVITPTEASAQP